MSLATPIKNEELRLSQIPPADADWDQIEMFALTFNGYDAHGGFAECAAIANARRSDSLTDLRTCLFFEQRRWRHFGDMPAGDDLTYIRSLVEQIRQKVASGDVLDGAEN